MYSGEIKFELDLREVFSSEYRAVLEEVKLFGVFHVVYQRP